MVVSLKIGETHKCLICSKVGPVTVDHPRKHGEFDSLIRHLGLV